MELRSSVGPLDRSAPQEPPPRASRLVGGRQDQGRSGGQGEPDAGPVTFGRRGELSAESLASAAVGPLRSCATRGVEAGAGERHSGRRPSLVGAQLSSSLFRRLCCPSRRMLIGIVIGAGGSGSAVASAGRILARAADAVA